MAGILDPKTRIIDFMMTELGREQASQGELNIKYATFTDRAAYYTSGSVLGVADDAAARIYFEAASSPHDSIVIENDFEGKIKPFRADEFEVEGAQVAKPIANPGKSSVLLHKEIIPIAQKILNSVTASIDSMQYLKTTDLFSEDRNFLVEPKKVFFEYNDSSEPELPVSPTSSACKSNVLIDNMNSLFQDVRLAPLPNFKFMPPRNLPSPENNEGNLMGDYTQFRDVHRAHQDPYRVHRAAYREGFDKREVFFRERTADNNIIMQPFEFTEAGVSKLSVIDGGVYVEEETRERRQIFYVGKLFADTKKTTTYVHIFTVVFMEKF